MPASGEFMTALASLQTGREFTDGCHFCHRLTTYVEGYFAPQCELATGTTIDRQLLRTGATGCDGVAGAGLNGEFQSFRHGHLKRQSSQTLRAFVIKRCSNNRRGRPARFVEAKIDA